MFETVTLATKNGGLRVRQQQSRALLMQGDIRILAPLGTCLFLVSRNESSNLGTRVVQDVLALHVQRLRFSSDIEWRCYPR